MLKIIDHGTVREIRLDRPPVNALNQALIDELIETLNTAVDQCDAIVLSGKDGLFSAGLDVVSLLPLDFQGMSRFWRSFFKLLETVACSPIPVTAAITGHSPAGGAVIALMCDYRVMSKGKYFIGLNETRVGLVIPPSLHFAMSRLVGSGMSEQLLTSGTMVDPEEALRMGLVNKLESGFEQTIDAAIARSKELLSLPRQAMLGNRLHSRASLMKEMSSHSDDENRSFVEAWFSDETQAAINAIVDSLKKRK